MEGGDMIDVYKREEFISSVMPSGLLDDAIEWIGDNLSPEEIFDIKELEMWAEDNGYIKEDKPHE
jgi:hypothetical protein